MLHTKHIINPNRVATNADLLSGPYPIGLTVEQFLDLFSDVKSFEGNGISIVDNTIIQQFGATDPATALSQLNQAVGNNNFSSFGGASSRSVVPVGQLTSAGLEPTNLSVIPSALVDYPFHLIGGGGAYVKIDFGRTLCFADLLYPYIEILFSTGMGNTTGGRIVGTIYFESYGGIPIFGGAGLSSLSIPFVGGFIRVKERYSSLRSSALSASPNAQLTFTAQSPLANLASYTAAYFGSVRVDTSPTASTINVTVPQNAKSGPVRFESHSPQFDTFLSYDDIRVAS